MAVWVGSRRTERGGASSSNAGIRDSGRLGKPMSLPGKIKGLEGVLRVAESVGAMAHKVGKESAGDAAALPRPVGVKNRR